MQAVYELYSVTPGPQWHPGEEKLSKVVITHTHTHTHTHLQAVYELYSVTPGPQWHPGEEKLSKVVIIGRNLNKQALTEWFTHTQAS